MVELKKLLLILYGFFFFWLIMIDIFRDSIKNSHLKGFFEFHLLSLPAVVVLGFAFKLSHSMTLLTLLWPHLALMSLMLFFCVLGWPKDVGSRVSP